jgi:biopolymer transport protein ExbD
MELLACSVSTCKQLLMAEITTGGGGGHQHKGARRSKKLSTKVDLTPMVDLGFLLITFFMISNVWSKPTVMKLSLPAGKETDMPVGESTALTIIPISGEKAFYYHGDLLEAIQDKQYGTAGLSLTGGIGDVIREKQQQLDKSYKGGRSEMVLIIKPTTGASYKSIVEILDEILINCVTKHVLTDITEDEKLTLTTNNLGWVLH